MQRRIAVLCLLFVLLTSINALAIEYQTKPKLAFYPLVAQNVDAISFTEGISTQLFNNIERTDFFEIVERKKLESALMQDAVTIASMSQDTLYALAHRAGFDIFIVGKVNRVESAALINLQVISSGSRNSYYTETFRVSEFEISKKIREITDKIVEKVKAFQEAQTRVETKISCPASVTATGTPKSIKLKWAPLESPQVIGYGVMRASSENGSYMQIATTTQPSYTDDYLKLNETFYYRIKAISKSGIECELSAPVVGMTSLAPLPPIFIELKSELGGARLNWYSRAYTGSDKKQITSGFQIYRKAKGETEYRPVAKVGAGTMSYLDNNLRNGVLYSYVLTSFNPDQVESEFSSALETKCAQAANDIKASGGKRRVQLTWTPNESKAVEGYSIYRSPLAEENFQKVGQVHGRSVDSYLDTGLADNTTYRYSLAARLDKHESPKSDPVQATTLPRPNPPAGLVAASSEPRKLSLSWQNTAKAEDGIKSFNLYRSGKKDGEFTRIAEVPVGRNSYLDDKEKGTGSKLSALMSDGSHPLADGATYYYRITCVNDAGSESLPSDVASATTRALLPAPGQLKATMGQAGKVTLNWDGTAEFTQYEVYRGAIGQSEVVRLKVVKEPFYTDSDVEHGASYIYAIKGIDAHQIPSSISTSVTGSTKPRPVPPKGVVLGLQQGKKVVQWEPNPERDVLRYVVYKKTLGFFHKLQTVFGTNFALDGLKGKQELRVAAEDGDGLESEKSEALIVELD